MHRRLIVAWLVLCLQHQVQAKDPLQSAMQGRVVLDDLDGESIARATPGTPFRIDASIENVAGVDAPAGLTLAGWLRPVSVRNMSCNEAARAYHATQRLPIGTVDLNGAALIADGHRQVRLQSEKQDPELVYRLKRKGLSINPEATALFVTSPLEKLPIPSSIVSAPLDLIGTKLSSLTKSQVTMVLAVPNSDYARAAISRRRGRDFVDGMIAGDAITFALLMTDRNLTQTTLMSALNEIDVSKFVDIIQ